MTQLALSQLIKLSDDALSLHDRISNQYDLEFATSSDSKVLIRLRLLIDRAFFRYQRRVKFERDSLYDLNKFALDRFNQTESGYSQTDLQICLICSGRGTKKNPDKSFEFCTDCMGTGIESGDSARRPASASEIAETQTVYDLNEAGQGGNQCPKFHPNDGRFCDCDDCTTPPAHRAEQGSGSTYIEAYDEYSGLHTVVCYSIPNSIAGLV